MRLPLRTEEVTIIIKDQEDQVTWMYTLHQSGKDDKTLFFVTCDPTLGLHLKMAVQLDLM